MDVIYGNNFQNIFNNNILKFRYRVLIILSSSRKFRKLKGELYRDHWKLRRQFKHIE
jgi:hypothetical protein